MDKIFDIDVVDSDKYLILYNQVSYRGSYQQQIYKMVLSFNRK